MHGGMLRTCQLEFVFMSAFPDSHPIPPLRYIKKATQPVMHSAVGKVTLMLQSLTMRLQDERTIETKSKGSF